MKEVSELDELLALKPADHDAATVKAAIAAITQKGADFKARAATLLEDRKKMMIVYPASKLNEMKRQAEAFETAAEQAAELVIAIQADQMQWRRDERIRTIKARHTALSIRRTEFAARFTAFYAAMVEQYVAEAKEYAELEAQRATLHREIDVASKPENWAQLRSGEVPNLWPEGEALKISVPAVCSMYFDRVCLPVAGLAADENMGAPMAHKGEFWTGDHDGPSKKVSAEMARQQREREARDEAELQRRRRQRKAELLYHGCTESEAEARAAQLM